MRNHFEHFDERLDRWWEQSSHHGYVDRNIGMVTAGIEEINVFRNYFPETGELVFWGDKFNLKAIHDVLFDLYPRLQEEVQKL